MLKIFQDSFEVIKGSQRGHKGVKCQVYKDAPIEMKTNGNDSYDLLDMLKIFKKSIIGH